MAVSRLARFHAVSFAFRFHDKEGHADLSSTYNFLLEDPVYNQRSSDFLKNFQTTMAPKVNDIAKSGPKVVREHAAYFFDAIQNMHSTYVICAN